MAVTIDGSAGVTTNAGGSVNPSTNVEGINYSCRAWVNFNGTGTVAIRGSGNVTSITDNGTGDYTVNFTTAMADANYATVITGARQAGAYNCITAINLTNTNYSTTACRITAIQTNDSLVDSAFICVGFFR